MAGRIKRWRYALEQICSYKFDARVTFSPKLRLPSVTVGPSYLRHYFDALWGELRKCVLVVSDAVHLRKAWAIFLPIPSAKALHPF